MFVRAATYLGDVNSVAQGNAAEAAVLQALTAAGLHALVPFGDGLPFDLGAVAPDGHVVRVQVKSGRVRNGCVEFNSSSTDHGRGQLHYRGRADVIAVRVLSLSRLFIVPVDDCPSSRGYLRLDEARNGQRRRVRRAEDYSFEAWVQSLSSTEQISQDQGPRKGRACRTVVPWPRRPPSTSTS